LCLFPWYYFLLKSVALAFYIYLKRPEIPVYTQTFMIAIFTLVAAVTERYIKEMWVKFRSFQMSEKFFRATYEGNPHSIIIIDK